VGFKGNPMPKYLYFYLVFNNDASYRVKLPTLENLKSDYIGYVLDITSDNVSETAEILHISRPTIHNRCKNYRLH
jgi:DNA-binding NtrC family response regulator